MQTLIKKYRQSQTILKAINKRFNKNYKGFQFDPVTDTLYLIGGGNSNE